MISKEDWAEKQPRRIFGRRQGRPLKAERQNALERLLPVLGIPEELIRQDSSLDPAQLLPEYQSFHLEIGFGNGEHLAGLAQKRKTDGFIGAEPFINGMSAFLKSIENMQNQNVRVWMDDAIRLVQSLEPSCLETIYILNPDPWPKKRHHKRRIVRPDTLDEYARVLKPGGMLVMATDVDELAGWMCEQTAQRPEFEWKAETASDWRCAPPDWIETRYEKKGRESGRRQSYLVFERK